VQEIVETPGPEKVGLEPSGLVKLGVPSVNDAVSTGELPVRAIDWV
jgi:hypothetical protein